MPRIMTPTYAKEERNLFKAITFLHKSSIMRTRAGQFLTARRTLHWCFSSGVTGVRTTVTLSRLSLFLSVCSQRLSASLAVRPAAEINGTFFTPIVLAKSLIPQAPGLPWVVTRAGV